jgi:hypothetical protein
VSVVEKAVPRGLVAWGVGAVALVVIVIAAVAIVGLPSQSADPASTTSTSTSTTRAPEAATSTTVAAPSGSAVTRSPGLPVSLDFDAGATYRIYLERASSQESGSVFAYIDVASGQLHYVNEQNRAGSVRARFGDTLVLATPERISFVDRDFSRDPVVVTTNGLYVGAWRGNAILAERFAERTTFNVVNSNGAELQSVALVGRPPDEIAGVVRDSVVVERGGRIILVGLNDATVRPLAVGGLLGVGGDRIYYTSCTLQGACAIHEATLDGTVRATPVGPYSWPSSDRIDAQVAPDGSGVILYKPRTGGQDVLAGGTRFGLTMEGAPHLFAWAPSGRLFVVDVLGPNRALDTIDYRTGKVTTVALAADVRRELSSVAAW